MFSLLHVLLLIDYSSFAVFNVVRNSTKFSISRFLRRYLSTRGLRDKFKISPDYLVLYKKIFDQPKFARSPCNIEQVIHGSRHLRGYRFDIGAKVRARPSQRPRPEFRRLLTSVLNSPSRRLPLLLPRVGSGITTL